MDDSKENKSLDLLRNIIGDSESVYYYLVMESANDPEVRAVKAEVFGNIQDLFVIPAGDDAFLMHRICEALDDNEKQRLREVLKAALDSLTSYEIELRAEGVNGKSVWLINKGEFKADPATKRIIQSGVITTVSAQMLRRNEYGSGDNRYHSVAGLMNDYVFTVRCKDGEVLETIHGGACKDVTGYTEQEFFDDSDLWFRMVHPRDKDLILERANKMARGEQVDELVHRIKHKNGRTRWVKSVIVPHYDEFGSVFLYDGVIRDITEQVIEQQNHEQLSYMNELLLDATPYPMILMQNDGIVLKANRAGYELGAVDEESCFAIWKKEIDATCEFRKLLDRSMDSDSIVIGDLSYEDKTFEVTIVPNEPDLLLACLHDVTQNRTMRERLQEDKMIMQAVFENTITSIMLLDKTGKFEAINNTASKILNISQAEITGLSIYEVFPKDQAEVKMNYLQQVVQGHQSVKYEEKVNGFELDTMILPVINEQSEVIKVAVFARDITKMKKAEENLIETYQVLTAIVENAPLVIVGLDMQRQVILWNEGAEHMTKIKSEDAYNKNIRELYDNADDNVLEAIDRAFEGHTVELKKANLTLLDGRNFSVFLNFAPKLNARGDVSGVIIMASYVE